MSKRIEPSLKKKNSDFMIKFEFGLFNKQQVSFPAS